MKFIVFYLQLINSREGLGMFFYLHFQSAGFASILRHSVLSLTELIIQHFVNHVSLQIQFSRRRASSLSCINTTGRNMNMLVLLKFLTLAHSAKHNHPSVTTSHSKNRVETKIDTTEALLRIHLPESEK